METSLDPINSPVKDEVAMNMLRLESRIAAVVDYLARLKVATSRIDTTLWPGETLQNDLESLMTRLNEVPSRVQEWKKSSARCGADVALSLVRVHCKDAREDKLAALKVALASTMEDTTLEIELHTRYYNLVFIGLLSSKLPVRLSYLVMNVKE